MLSRLIPFAFSFLLIGVLSGCSTLVEKQLLSRSTGVKISLEPGMLEQLGFESREFCLPHLGGCTRYLYGAESLESETIKQEFKLHINDVEQNLLLDLAREDIVVVQRGTIILLHGYSADKTTMAMQAAYFRFLGFHVVIPDLRGHGESSFDQPGFGVLDAAMVDTLIDSLPARERPHPLYLAGFSMGAIAATHIAAERHDIAGLILFAPMREFSDAVLKVAHASHPYKAKLLGDKAIRKGAEGALNRLALTPEQLDIRKTLPPLQVPTLVLASRRDGVAPYDYLQPLQSNYIQVQEVTDRIHPIMGIVDNPMHQQIYGWMLQQR